MQAWRGALSVGDNNTSGIQGAHRRLLLINSLEEPIHLWRSVAHTLDHE